MPTAIIADDEYLQRDELKRQLNKLWPELAIVAECEDGGEALDAIQQYQPDIAFLDIRMPDLSGLDVARASNGACHIVFVTAFEAHALEAFHLAAIDYLLKPLMQDRLKLSINRLQEKLKNQTKSSDLIKMMDEFEQRLRKSSAQERIRWISVSAGKAIQIFPIEEILFFESDTRYTRVVTASSEGLIRTPIKELQAGLDPEQFWQINRGILVNMSAISRASRDETGAIKVDLKEHNDKLKVSQTYAWRFRAD